MSGDVQPRKRKDKKKKRDDEASHGVHVTKMGSDDVLLHVHEEHGTGGHWCAKVIFFSLMVILMGLVCLIILENRGISDVDTPLSESRFSNYFDGWVDEHRDDHDSHHGSQDSLEHDEHDDEHDDEDDHDEPFEEEADHSEGDEEVAEDEDDNVTPEEEDEDDDNATAENVTAEEDREEDGEEDDDEEDEDNVTGEVDGNVTAEEADDDNVTAEDENEATVEQAEDDDEDEEDNDNDNKTNEDDEGDNTTKETSKPTSQGTLDDDNDDDAFDEEDDDDDDDDGTLDSLERIVDNDAAELELLKAKARQQEAAESKQNVGSAENDPDDVVDNAPSWASSLTIKIGVGLALALVARLVLIRKKPISNEDAAPEIIMKRRLTIATPEENIPEHIEDIDEPLPEDDYSEEEIEIEEEIEYIEEEVEPIGEENQIDAGDNDYVPETFEQLNAMYRPTNCEENTEQIIETKPSQTQAYSSSYTTTFNNDNNRNNNKNSKFKTDEETPKSWETTHKPLNNSSNNNNNNSQKPTILKLSAPVFEAPSPAKLVETQITVLPKHSPPKETAIKQETSSQAIRKEVTYDRDYEKAAKEKPEVEHKKEITHDMDYQPDTDDIDYDEDDIYDDEEAPDDESEDLDDEDLLDDDDLEESDADDASDIDDSELMNRLESKYGKLPAKEYESDEDPDDPTWTQIKPKTGGGPQSLEDDELDLFERDLRKANDEMMQERYDDAWKSFDRLIQKYPHAPQTYLGKAQTLDHYAEQRKSNSLLMEAITMYKTYLEFNVVDEEQLQEYRSAAERCVERMRFLGYYQQSLHIHHLLIDKFPQESSIRNELAVTFLILNRLLDAKQVLQEILQRWPQNGLALVHYGFILKQLDHDYYNASIYLRKGIESNAEGTKDGRFYFHLGEALQRQGKQSEAMEIFRKGADLKLFPSAYQRSLYNEANLKAQPFWTLEETTYEQSLKKLQDNWLAIQAEGLSILSKTNYFLNETENLKNKGDWKQFELYARGQQRRENCLKAPITCGLIAQFPAARDCRRCQVKFSVMLPGTHIWPHCGPTNCRLRAHLGLVVPTGTRIRVAEEESSWQEGKFLIFDDSFEHEVWHEGQGVRLVLIVDIWHPQLTEQQRRSLSPI